MLYAVVATVIIGALFLSWARRVVKRALVQPVRLDNGLVGDMRLTEKTRWQVFWEEWRGVVYFVSGVIAGAWLGAWK